MSRTFLDFLRSLSYTNLCLLPAFLLPVVAYPATETDTTKVVRILDGDTIEVSHDRRSERIRLNGIDCPEKGQAYGKKAKQAIAKLIFRKDVTLQKHGMDKYGRTIADVILADGTNVNHELVKQGWCWWYRKYAPGNSDLQELEQEARDAKKGLWIDPAPIPPWIYRQARREKSLERSDSVTSPRGPPLYSAVGADFGSDATYSPYPIVGNQRTRIYHRPDCPNYSQVAKPNRVPFKNEEAAESAGYRKAHNCH